MKIDCVLVVVMGTIGQSKCRQIFPS